MVLGAEEAVDQSIRTAEKIIGARAVSAEFVGLMATADRALSKRLGHLAKSLGDSTTFTVANLKSYRAQIVLVRKFVEKRLQGATEAVARAAIAEGLRNTLSVLEALEARYAGVVRPLRLGQAAVMDRAVRGTNATLLGRYATSVDRYGTAMQVQFERVMRQGLIQGASQREMVMALTGHGGPKGKVSLAAKEIGGQVIRLKEEVIPEGLFRRKRYWAERIVRTETANAYNAAAMNGMVIERNADFPDLGKKILATFDDRTAYDSMAVHGQVRKLEELFEDGAGRRYQHPPARPNDRETVIPWRMPWKDTKKTRLPTAKQLIDAKQKQMAKRPKKGVKRAEDADVRLKAQANRAEIKEAKKLHIP